MKLSDLHIEILSRTRESLGDIYAENPRAYSFVCDAIAQAAESAQEATRGIPEGVSMREIAGAREALLNAVMIGLCGFPTVSGYLGSFVPGFADLPGNEYRRVANLAHLAWLDRAIESREFA